MERAQAAAEQQRPCNEQAAYNKWQNRKIWNKFKLGQEHNLLLPFFKKNRENN
jgi:hypothetical protein